MDRKKLLKLLEILILIIFVVNFLANKFYWYYSIWYLDMIVHFLGGFWIGLLFFYVFKQEIISFSLILKILFLVFIIGLGWEAYEAVVNEVFARNIFNVVDSISDVFFDLAGGSLAILYFFKGIMTERLNKVE